MLNVGIVQAAQIHLPAIYVANGFGVCLLLALLYAERRSPRTRSRDGRLFRAMCRLCAALCLLETAAFVLEGRQFSGARAGALACNTLLMLLGTGLACLWACYVDCRLVPDRKRLPKTWYLAALPAAAVGVLALVNLAVPVLFGVSETNRYYRGPWYVLPWAVAYGYLFWGVFRSCRRMRRADRHVFLPVLLFLVPVLAGSLIQLFCYGLSLIWASAALGLNLLYLNLQREQVFLDPLTGLYNRSYLLHYMAGAAEGRGSRGVLTGLMLDINDFKKINDTGGHAGGDTVLRAVGRILAQAAGDQMVIRYGGDEFIILVEGDSPDTIRDIREKIRRGLQSYNEAHASMPPVSVSGGVAVHSRSDMVRFLHEMDMRMYAEKRTLSGQEPQSGTAAGEEESGEDP